MEMFEKSIVRKTEEKEEIRQLLVPEKKEVGVSAQVNRGVK